MARYARELLQKIYQRGIMVQRKCFDIDLHYRMQRISKGRCTRSVTSLPSQNDTTAIRTAEHKCELLPLLSYSGHASAVFR